MTIPLSQATLADLPPSVGRPTYDRARITPGIVHIGVGNFHRAHQAWYMEALFRRGLSSSWGIIGGGVRAADAAMRRKLEGQDWLTTLVSLSPDGQCAEITGSMIGFAAIEDGHAPLIAAMADPRIRIVTLTVTEGGYFVGPTGEFDSRHPDIHHDVGNPKRPRTAFGAILSALRSRRKEGHKPFTCQSCDNLQGNGDALCQAVLGLARMSDPEFADWIEMNCSFPNSMVDCIVPYTGPREIALARDLGIEDSAPVTHEPFRMWVIEDKFCDGRPEWEAVGAIFTDDIHGFERAKIRILNGGGQVLGAAADLLGIELVADAMTDDRLQPYFRKCEIEEILPHVPAIPGYTPDDYLNLVVARFSNRAMRDTTRRFAHDGSSRQPGFLLPSVRDGLASGTSVDGLALASALWSRYCRGYRENGSVIESNDPNWDTLRQQAEASVRNPTAWLALPNIYGDLANAARFKDAFVKWCGILDRQGVVAALSTYVG